MSRLPIIERAIRFRERIALIDPDGSTHTYGDLLHRSQALGAVLLDGRDDLAESRVAYLTEPGSNYVTTQWAVWGAGGIGVPLAVMHPDAELEFVIRDSGAGVLVSDSPFAPRVAELAKRLGCRFIPVPGADSGHPDPVRPDIDVGRRAMIVYTSGSTGKPKGVVTTHANVVAQIESLTRAWAWSADDRILLTLPLHHVHGIINVLGCALWSGATCIVHQQFDPERVWRSFCHDSLSVFMAVPTIYRRLIDYWESTSRRDQDRLRNCCRTFRLMVSGSAALPARTLEQWRDITGHTLLERYGMTEIGMALSNPLRGERRAGHVGTPLPGVDVRLVNDDGEASEPGTPGEICVRGPGVFEGYWNRPEDTRAAFDGGWFKTGDVAVVSDGSYRILGRRSVDIIKTGGYKVSALEVEEVLRQNPAVSECAVVGVPDIEWGERIAVAVEGDAEVTLDALRSWARTRLAPYKIPSLLATVERLPRNALGKIVKPDVAVLFRRDTTA